jgi:pimeloyl-ACP methyl ester carboxylesterase
LRGLGLAATLWVANSGAAATTLPGSEGDLLQGKDPAAAPGLLVRLPDRRVLNFRCEGEGRPTVLFESGFAATSLAWTKVQKLLSPRYRTCAYDRAGYGYSDPGPMPRDGVAVARDLDDGLKAAHIAGPYIFVGHSAGALYVRLFQARRRRDVRGMVLVDPSVAHQDSIFAAEFGPGAGSLAGARVHSERCLAAALAHELPSTEPLLARCTAAARAGQSEAVRLARLPEALRPATWRTRISELDTLWGRTSREVDALASAGRDLPLIILTADSGFADAPPVSRAKVAAFWTRLHQTLATISRRGRARLVVGSSHMMMFDRPEAISEAVDDIAAELARSSTGQGDQ